MLNITFPRLQPRLPRDPEPCVRDRRLHVRQPLLPDPTRLPAPGPEPEARFQRTMQTKISDRSIKRLKSIFEKNVPRAVMNDLNKH